MNNQESCGKINTNKGWLICPKCGRAKVLRLLPSTECKDLVVHCKVCKQESIVNIPSVPAP